MSKATAAPFERGATAYAGATPDASNLKFETLLGMEKTFEDIDWSATGAKTFKSGRLVTCRVFRNTSGGALLPKNVAYVDPANPGNVSKKCDGDHQHVIVVDEYLPAAGVVDDDVFWGVIKGPCTALVDAAAAGWSAGQQLTSKATGKCTPVDASPDDATEAQNQSCGTRLWAIADVAQNDTSGRVIIGEDYR